MVGRKDTGNINSSQEAKSNIEREEILSQLLVF